MRSCSARRERHAGLAIAALIAAGSLGGLATAALQSGSQIGWPPSAPMLVKLQRLPEAALPRTLVCSPHRPGTFAGFVGFDRLDSVGKYDIAVTPDARIDVVQDRRDVPPVG